MRTILFRGKRIDNQQWVEGEVFNQFGKCYIQVEIVIPEIGDIGYNTYEVIPSTVGQFTGLTDKHGNKIWEGDKDKDGNYIGWNSLHNCWGFFNQYGYKRGILSEYYNDKGEITIPYLLIEVIGNIHEEEKL